MFNEENIIFWIWLILFGLPYVSVGQTVSLPKEGKISYISDNEFNWIQNPNCAIANLTGPIYKKVEIDPRIQLNDKGTFSSFLNEKFKQLNIDEKISGTLKLKLLFSKNRTLCIQEMGLNNITSSEIVSQIYTLFEIFPQNLSIIPARHKLQIVHSQALLYLVIEKGRLVRFQRKNFGI
jgi:hypothetical protein